MLVWALNCSSGPGSSSSPQGEVKRIIAQWPVTWFVLQDHVVCAARIVKKFVQVPLFDLVWTLIMMDSPSWSQPGPFVVWPFLLGCSPWMEARATRFKDSEWQACLSLPSPQIFTLLGFYVMALIYISLKRGSASLQRILHWMEVWQILAMQNLGWAEMSKGIKITFMIFPLVHTITITTSILLLLIPGIIIVIEYLYFVTFTSIS